jgi:hypothetical protein
VKAAGWSSYLENILGESMQHRKDTMQKKAGNMND